MNIDRTGMATVTDSRGRILQMRMIPANLIPTGTPGTEQYRDEVFALSSELARKQETPYDPYHVVVVFRDGVTAQDRERIPTSVLKRVAKARLTRGAAASPPSYTNDASINAAMAKLGVSEVRRLFSRISRAQLSAMRSQAQARTGRPLLNIGNAFSVTLSESRAERAVTVLRALPGVAYASLDWTYGPSRQNVQALPEAEHRNLRNANVANLRRAVQRVRRASSATAAMDSLPSNYGFLSSMQSMSDASGVDATTAYQEVVDRFHQLPGAGVTITNVSLGAIAAASDAKVDASCRDLILGTGTYTHVVGGQRYIDWPGMPLIPAYAADPEGVIDPSYVSCGEGDLGEIGLDFSVMAPLPDNLQRPGAQADRTIGDIVGIAPGANYRLVVPATNVGDGNPTSVLAIDGALLGAALQTPAPDVITMSLGPAYDFLGFPGRWYEEDPISASLIASIVNTMNIVVCISANDGSRNTWVAIGPSGGSAPTDLAPDQYHTTVLNDVALSTAPSLSVDTGSIDVGATTLNDVFSMPPTDPQYAQYVNQLAFPETRFNGSQDISSGFGTRVNISAPGDNIRMITKTGVNYNDVSLLGASGTSASAPEVAAAAAVAIQVARLTGHPFPNARAVRDFLVQTATAVPQAAQTDRTLNVGPQLNVRRAVETLLSNANVHVTPAVNRVAIAQRRVFFPTDTFSSAYATNTDPTSINLEGLDYGGGPDGSGNTDWITLAPDWQGIPDSASFALYVQGHPEKVLSNARFARLLPSAILNAVGMPLASNATRTVHLTYRAGSGRAPLAKVNFDLTFGPSDGTSYEGFAPVVPPVVTGSSFQVQYDVSKVRNMSNPLLVISEPGRPLASWRVGIHFPYVKPLSEPSGAVTVNVSDLQGGGMYGVGILSEDPVTHAQHLTDQALFRVQQGSSARAKAPLLQVQGSSLPFGHFAELAYNDSVNVSWDASNVPGANGAMLEVSAPGPTLIFLFNTWNNPNGTIPDANGLDSGSVKLLPLPGVRGQATFKASELGLADAMFQTVRILPVNGQNAAGEASDVSTIVRDGVSGSFANAIWDRGNLPRGGFGINPSGSNFIASWNPAGEPGAYNNALDIFDGTTGQNKQVAVDLQVNAPWFVPGGGALGGSADSSLLVQPLRAGSDLQEMFLSYSPLANLNPQGSGQVFPTGFPLFNVPTGAMLLLSANPGSSTGAALYYDTSQEFAAGSQADPPGVLQIPVQLQKFDATNGLPIGNPIATPVLSNYTNSITLFNADMSLDKAVIVRQPFVYWAFDVVPSIDVIDMSSGQTQEVPSIANGASSSLAIDETTHVAMTDSVADIGLVLFNIQTPDQQTKVFLPRADEILAWYNPDGTGAGENAFTPQYIAADPVNHLFLVWQGADPRVLDSDFNSTGELLVYDERGTLLKSIKGWTWAARSFTTLNMTNYLQVNGNLRKAYLMMSSSQVAIIDY